MEFFLTFYKYLLTLQKEQSEEMEFWGIAMHLIEYHNFTSEKDNLVAASPMPLYTDRLGMQHVQKATAGEWEGIPNALWLQIYPKSVFKHSQNDAMCINQLGQR